jgi:transcriptional regulator with XRE-family HTH domain
VDASTNSQPVAKRRKVPKSIRQPQILALQAAGLTQEQVAQEMGVSRQSITRDLREIAPAKAEMESNLARLNTAIDRILSVDQKAEKYVALATSAKNEAVSLGALQRIDDLAGIVTEKELVRSKRNEPAAPQAMFMLPPGTSISFSATAVIEKRDDVINITPQDVVDSQ